MSGDSTTSPVTTTCQNPVVECADRLRALSGRHPVLRTALALLIFGACMVIGVGLGRPWIGVCGLFLVAGFFLIPLVLRQHRILTSLPCPRCQQAVGRYVCRETRVHLRCEHCGQESPTDCAIIYAGAKPTKM